MRDEVSNWWNQAVRDIESAERIMEIGDYYISAFLSQQAVEKAFKALLIQQTDSYPRIHDIVELARRVNATSRIIELCAGINPAYTATRYPDIASKFEENEVKEIMIYAKEVLEWIKKELKF